MARDCRAAAVTSVTRPGRVAPWLHSHLHSGFLPASCSCYQLRVCLPGLGSLTASRMFDRWRQIRRLSTHLTEDFITPHSVSEHVCVRERECVLITPWPEHSAEAGFQCLQRARSKQAQRAAGQRTCRLVTH